MRSVLYSGPGFGEVVKCGTTVSWVAEYFSGVWIIHIFVVVYVCVYILK